ncbi:hypothetical protein [Streptomyces gelaticus]|uniref:hypothetical protein n=1 Tax=Streptomyces gelaticus TaxID=285446 RepID=UPI001674ED44|nr:hypothetical protein [Streptomyces gelaticus]
MIETNAFLLASILHDGLPTKSAEPFRAFYAGPQALRSSSPAIGRLALLAAKQVIRSPSRSAILSA